MQIAGRSCTKRPTNIQSDDIITPSKRGRSSVFIGLSFLLTSFRSKECPDCKNLLCRQEYYVSENPRLSVKTLPELFPVRIHGMGRAQLHGYEIKLPRDGTHFNDQGLDNLRSVRPRPGLGNATKWPPWQLPASLPTQPTRPDPQPARTGCPLRSKTLR